MHQKIARGVARNFLAQADVKDDHVTFLVDADDFFVEAVICVVEPEDNCLAAEVNFWLCSKDNSRLNYIAVDPVDLLYFREVLSSRLRWGQIVIEAFTPKDMGAAMYLCIDTSTEDIEQMVAGSKNSRLLRNLVRLFTETALLYPALYGIATGQLSDPATICDWIADLEERRN